MIEYLSTQKAIKQSAIHPTKIYFDGTHFYINGRQFVKENSPEPETQPDNEIWYTSTDGNIVETNYSYLLGSDDTVLTLISNTYKNGKGVIKLSGPLIKIKDGYEQDEDHFDGLFILATTLQSVSIPNSVTSIGDFAFIGCSGLTSITIPNSVTSIGDGAFASCENLTSISILSNVTSIGKSAFSGCLRLTSIELGDSITSIGEMAFYLNTSLKLLTINTVIPPTLAEYAFQGAMFTSIFVPSESVDAYKAAEGWSSHASVIKAIGEEDTPEPAPEPEPENGGTEPNPEPSSNTDNDDDYEGTGGGF